MNDQSQANIVVEQQKAKSKIEEIISEYLGGEAKQSITKLLEMCKASGIKTPGAVKGKMMFII